MSSRPGIITVLFTVLSLLYACAPFNSVKSLAYAEPDPETYVSLLPPVLEYFHYRKQAVLTGDFQGFYTRYPDLEHNTNIESGINTESKLFSNMHAMAPFDCNILPEYYEKIKISQSENDVQVLVHGRGEFKLVLYMRQHENT